MLDILQHAETVVETGVWTVLGWWKSSSIAMEKVAVPKAHIVSMKKNVPILP
jgi:hypothetical protein